MCYLIVKRMTQVFASIVFMLSMNATAIVGGHEYIFSGPDDIENKSRGVMFQKLAKELRCPKCQNQNLSDSDSMIAGDLRRELYSQVKDGKNSQQIIDFMVNRYGEFVLYRPALNNRTMALWYGPFVLLVLALLVFASIIVKQKYKNKTVSSVTSAVTNLVDKSSDDNPSEKGMSEDEQKRIDELLNSSSEDAKKDGE
jgi:cytochrome c-type biogenesis protein CcmH